MFSLIVLLIDGRIRRRIRIRDVQKLTDQTDPEHCTLWKESVYRSVADPRCLSKIRFFPSRKPDAGLKRFRIPVSDLHQRIWVFSTQNIDTKFAKNMIPDPGSGSCSIPDPDPGSRGSKKYQIPDLQHWFIGTWIDHPPPWAASILTPSNSCMSQCLHTTLTTLQYNRLQNISRYKTQCGERPGEVRDFKRQ